MQTSKIKHQKSKSGFDLEERFALFGEQIIEVCKQMPETTITRPLISQVVRSSTSIGANYAEANNSSSRKDYGNKVYISKKEAQETKHWLRMLSVASPEQAKRLSELAEENREICLILQSIANKLKGGLVD